MKKTGLILIAIFLSIALLPAGDNRPTQAAGGPQLQEAPRLPSPRQPPPVIDGHGTGFIPPPMNLSHLTGKQPQGKLMAVSLPASFDWRDYNKVTSVKNQGSCGSCYAFAAIANFESKILKDGAAVLPDPDYSENNAKECNYYQSSCYGGWYEYVASLFSQKGVVNESCDPYVPANVSCNSTCPYQKTLTDWRIISGPSIPDTTVLKNYIMTYGPVFTTLYASGLPGFGSYDGSYTFNWTAPSAYLDHAVLIVGWSNNLPPDQQTGMPGDGWIVKNSWGSDWGDQGYFYIHYGAANIGMYSSFVYSWQDYNPNGGIMYYDEGGNSAAWGYTGSTTAWGLCRFTPQSNTYATSVEFWTWDATTDIDVYIYDDFDGSSLSTLRRSQLNYSFSEAGYYQVRLDSPLPLTSGDDVIVVVKFTNNADKHPVVADYVGPWETNRTYVSPDGTNGSWTDLGYYYYNDVAIRLRTATNYTLTLAVSGNGTTTPAAGSYTYAPMEVVNITAIPDAGWSFMNWTTPDTAELANASANSTTVTMDKCKTVTANFGQPPLANFTADATAGCEPLVVNFTDLSSGIPSNWSWTFGDGNTSTAQNPSHTYYAGTYNITLNASNICGWNATAKTGYIAVNSTPTANFTANVTDGCKPLTVSFTNTSSGNITGWSWTFGEGNTSTEQSPTYTYNNTGIYLVNLTVTNADNCSDTRTDSITVRDVPAVNFTASPLNGYTPLTVNFTDLSTGNVTGWSWAFGDGGNSAAASPTHNYTAAGTYTVNLTVDNACGANTTSKARYISVMSTPSGGGGGGGGSMKEAENYLSVTMLGNSSKYKIGAEGNLTQAVEVSSGDGRVILSLGKGTACLDPYGRWLSSITIKKETSPPSLPENHQIVGQAYKLGPEGASFYPALNLTLGYEDNNIPQYVSEKDIYIACNNAASGSWSALPSQVNTENNTITAPVTHFTTFAIMGIATPPRAEFTITSLDLSSTRVKPGEELTASVTAANTGDAEGNYSVNLTINGKVEQTKTVTLAPSAAERVTFTISKDTPGIYTVSIGGLGGEFTVTPPSWFSRLWFPIVVVAIALGAILAYLIHQRRGRKA